MNPLRGNALLLTWKEKSARESFMPFGPPEGTMDNWMDMMTEAMTGDQTDVVATHRLLTQCQDAAMKEVQMLLQSSEDVSQAMVALYGALSAYVQTVTIRAKAEGAEPGDLDHAFRTGQSYGVSCVLNHLIDDLVDPNAGSILASLDEFSDSLHNEITTGVEDANLTVEVLDAKGNMI